MSGISGKVVSGIQNGTKFGGGELISIGSGDAMVIFTP